MTREELIAEIMEDPGNQLFGLPLGQIRKMIYEAQNRGVDPYKVFRLETTIKGLEKRIKELEEYESMYKGLCK